MSRKRASGPVRARVLAALRAAVDERGPGCFASQRAAAKALAAVLPDSVSSIRRALGFPQSDLEAAAIDAAIRPCSPLDGADVSRDRNAGFGGEPVVSHPGEPPVSQVSHPGSPSDGGMASPQVAHGEPPVSHPDASRAREPRCSASSAPLCSPQAPSPASAPFVSSLGAFPTRSHPSRFAGECLTCGCWLEEGQGLILVKYVGEARLFCIDCVDEGLKWAQIEWRLAHGDPPKRDDRRSRKPRKTKSDPNPSPEE